MSAEELQDLVEQIEDMPAHTVERVALEEEAIRLADSLNDLKEGYRLRKMLTSDAQFAGLIEKSFVAFAWCLGKSDENPDLFPESELLWSYKWMVSSAKKFPNISKKRVLDLLEDFSKRLQRCGYNRRSEYSLRIAVLESFGEIEESEKVFPVWVDTPRDSLSDCKACDLNHVVCIHYRRKEYQAGLDAAQPIFARQLRCTEVPRITYSSALLPLLLTGRKSEAELLHRRGFLLCKNNLSCLGANTDHLLYLVAIGDVNKGTRLFAKNLEVAFQSKNLDQRKCFFQAAKILLKRRAELGTKVLRFKLPESFPLYSAKQQYDIQALITWFDKECLSITKQFDVRNGNSYWTDKLLEVEAEMEDLIQLLSKEPSTPSEEE